MTRVWQCPYEYLETLLQIASCQPSAATRSRLRALGGARTVWSVGRERELRIRANGVDFAYLESGRGKLVILAHGFPDTAHTWDWLRPRIAERGYRVVAPFMRGYYPTEIPKDGAYDSDTLGRDLIGLIEAFGEEQAILVGHDWGASAAYSAAGLVPERVSRLITTAVPHPGAIQPSLKLLWRVRHFFSLSTSGAPARVAQNDFAEIDELVQRWSPTWSVPRGEFAEVKEAFRQPGCLDAALGYYRALSPLPPKGHRRPIEVPSVGIAGADDPILEPFRFHQAARMFRAGYRVLYVPGGHLAHRVHPEAFLAALNRALDWTPGQLD
ncbi:MAG: alpha/beta hydrolase [Myxococcales bacterium]|nr:alpha/beta hydrolase [Myxococcales bacterium]